MSRAASLQAEAAYKEQLACDLDRAGAWQAPLHRAKAKQLRDEAKDLERHK